MEETLKKFKEYLNKIQQYNQAVALFMWDMQTGAPKESVESKIDSIGYFSTEVFRLSNAPEYGEMLEELGKPENFEKLDQGMQVTVRRYLRDFERTQRVPEEFYTELVTTQARSEQAWEEAKEADDFSIFAPHLDKVIRMMKEYVHYMEPDQDVYEVLIDMFEEGMNAETIDKLFDELKAGLAPLIEKINASEQADISALDRKYDIEAQKKVQDYLLRYIGFNFDRGTTGESMHPFTTTLCPGDVRVTNHYDETMPLSAMFSAIHEGGHAIFDQNINPEFRGTAAAEVNMMGLHESQSRFFENILGRNINFWIPIYDDIRELMPQLKEVPLETFMSAVNYVHPSLIRTEADEVTYCMHIILRYEMEKAIFKDHVPTDQLPELWNQKMKELLGVVPDSDASGILQDMHWSDGSFGYFPSYLLGSIYDGMFYEAAQRDLGDLDRILREGRVKEVTAWLNENIHRYGSCYTSKEVLERVCHQEVSAEPLLKFFEKRYSEIYNF